jgi:1-phosphofructokinase
MSCRARVCLRVEVPKAVCITPNTAIDYIVELGSIVLGTTTRSRAAVLVPAGKGVDVAVGVATLGGSGLATGFIGEGSRSTFASLHSEGVESDFVEVPGHTRINVTLAEDNGRETHLQTTGYSVGEKDLAALIALIDRRLTSMDVAVLAGSLPPHAPEATMERLVRRCLEVGAYVVLDSSGAALRSGLTARPHMIKPNLAELAELTRTDVEDTDEGTLSAARGCLDAVRDAVVVSRGPKGILFVGRGEGWSAHVDAGRDTTTAGVGSGDAVVAALVAGRLHGQTVEETVRLASACGTANLFTAWPGRFNQVDVARLLPKVVLRRLY